jgi:hypothetical protein
MTPKQISGHTQLMHRRIIADRASDLAIIALGAQGEGRVIKKQLDEWEKES